MAKDGTLTLQVTSTKVTGSMEEHTALGNTLVSLAFCTLFVFLLPKTNNRYEGYWIDNKQHGTAKEFWPDGTRYQGEFANNLKHGTGKLIFPDGNVYVGNFKYGCMDGQG